MQSPYYTNTKYKTANIDYHSLQIAESSSSPVGDWLEREEALLADLDVAQPHATIPPTLSTRNSNTSLPPHAYNSALVIHRHANPRVDISNSNSRINGLRQTSEIPKPFDSIFKFGVFNVIQSKCLEDTFYQNNNLVISAPTGSGKTVIMELAIIRALLHNGINSKVIYMAPTKSLCSERAKDWQLKFQPLGIECKAFTGDTQISFISVIQKTTIIVTTPEKWDSMTRRWNDHKQLMKLINLFLIDEVHILNEKRGACLEACVSRMETMDINLRCVAVSATVPNVEDIATWLHAKSISFSEEYRPIKLERFVYGFQYREENMFLFDRRLDWKLLEMIEKHSDNKPVLIFCSTRKSTEKACATIANLMDKKHISTLSETGYSAQNNTKFKDKSLTKFVARGIAFHHAGLEPYDRSQVEIKYRNREIRVIATTSTLAVGVNLPAHLVIIKSTQGYNNGSLDEYPDIDLLQMMGRAGRPGLDTSGSVVILTTLQMESRYKSIVSGTTNLESRLHENLIEHLVSEICLGSIKNQATAIKWLQSTFLYVRLLKNPLHYKLSQGSLSSTTILQEICNKSLDLLQHHNLIEKADDSSLKATKFGYAMDNYYISFPTMVLLMESETPTSVKDTLQLISNSHEEMNFIRFNQGDKQFLNSVKNHNNIRFPLEKVASTSDKICMMIQCVLGDISMNNSTGGNTLLAIEGSNVMKHSNRIVKCLIDCSVFINNAAKLKYAMEMYQCLQARMWSNSPYVARQLHGIGTQYAKTIAQANLINFDQLRRCDPGRFEQLLHRNPPFGIKLSKEISILPNLALDIYQLPSSGAETDSLAGTVIISIRLIVKMINTDVVTRNKQGKTIYIDIWTGTSENRLVDFRRKPVSKLLDKNYEFDLKVEIESSTSTIEVHAQCEDYVGLDIQKEFKPSVNPRKFISVGSASNISKPTAQKSSEENPKPIVEDTFRERHSPIEASFDPMDLDDDDIEIQEIFQSPILAPTFTQPPPSIKTPNWEVDIDEIDDNINSQMYDELFREFSNTQAGPSTSFESKGFKNTYKKEPASKKKAKKPPVLTECKHQCRFKDRCRHKCCKRMLGENNDDSSPTATAGIKRSSPESKDQRPSKERRVEHEAENTASQTDLLNFFPQLSKKDVKLSGDSDNTISENSLPITEELHHSTVNQSMVDQSFTDQTIIDQSIADDIDNDSMASNDNDALIQATRPLNTLSCEELWDEAGKIAHEAFSTLNQRNNPKSEEPVAQQPDHLSEEKTTIVYQFPTLKDWIKNSIIIVDDEPY